MATHIKDNRWAVQADDFAAKVTVGSLQGYFKSLPKGRTLVVEPGTKALVIENGVTVGVISGGSYTLESFVDQLQFWNNRQVTVILTRAEDVPLVFSAKDMPTLDSVCIDIEYRWTLQVSDISRFLENLMGPRDELSVSDIVEAVHPIANQAVATIVGKLPYDSVEGPDFVGLLREGLHAHLESRLARYGLVLTDVQSVSVRSDVDGLRERRGEQWLHAREVQMQRAANAIENNALRAKLEDIQGKIPVRQQLRESFNSDKLNIHQSKDEFERALLEIDKQRILTNEERDELVAAYESRRVDREQLRAHLVATMDMHREQELEELRLDTGHALKQKSLQQELELAQLVQSEEAQRWRHALQEEREQSEHRHQQRHDAVKASWGRIREARTQKRADSWESILHEQRMEEVRQDLEVAKAERARRVALIQADLQSRLADESLKAEQRRQEWELEHKQKRSESQLDRMQKLQEMNAQFSERQQRMQLEIENLKQDGASKRDLDRIQAMSGLSTEALVATAAGENAALLADLKKHEATQDAAKAQAALNPATEIDAERLKMYEKLNDAERAKADAIAEAYKLAMQSQQGNVQQMIGGLAQAATPPAPQWPGAAGLGMPGASPPPMPAAETWHVSINGQQSPALQLVQVQQYIQAGHVTRATMVWKTGMPTWLAAGQVVELAHLFQQSEPPPMPGGPPPMPQ